ncbi:dienelactone hydrolase endo-1-3,1,4-beta-D-glucanase [Stereum hirsutum FP-91666 SS1]|uniref:dienelactone hydrolase endo-1-3,1,4-beta-D-glucanase n=1 Tax=Stereum hirsutum (strain FP-91666) TaxID=721885 RepID=UPI0004449911|nr:dienelactone hydrolase endo-1-3,1,4-beta-D-glucanase [Stereum hirsutum FP-91666 SS1]EIM86030.1 dienelactone hydrolase endo-1-3,1,4-beta-D-glucanase [Stereum hirsutum FP-91666 SS1]
MSCENCFKGNVLPGDPTGTMVDGAYYCSAANMTTKKAIVLLTDAFGLSLVNPKILADRLAEKVGVDVWVPDLFNGWPIVEGDDLQGLWPERAGEKISFLNKLWMAVVFLKRMPRIIASRPTVADARVRTFIDKLKTEKKYEKLGLVGFCYGGGCVVRVASNPAVSSIVVCHPTPLSNNCEPHNVQCPAAWVCAEDDSTFTPSLRQEAEAIFAARKDKPEYIDYEFKDYKGTVHGFAARPNLGLPEIRDAFERSLEQTTEWFNKTL